MKALKLLHCADLHLDAPFSSLGASGSLPDIRRQELKAAFSRIVDTARKEAVDYMLVCGDLFEHDYVRRSTIRYVCDELERIPEIQVLIIPGNHDPLVPGSYYYDSGEWPGNVHILSEREPIFISREGDTRIYGCIPDKKLDDTSKINILMAHGTLDMDFSRDAYNHLTSDDLESYGFDYIALGHFHKKYMGLGSRHVVYNPGSPEPLGFDEEGEHGVFVVSIEKTGNDSLIKANFIPIGSRRFRNAEVFLDGCATDEQAAQKATDVLDQASDLYRMTLRGSTAPGFRVNTDRVGSILGGRAFFIKIIDSTRPDYDLDSIAQEPGLKGLFTRELLKRALDAKDEAERQKAMQALYFGLEAIEQGSVTVGVNAY